MTYQEREMLIEEKKVLEQKFKVSEFINPKDMRRVDEIISLLLSNGSSDKLRFGTGKAKESKRVTSFTRDRR